MTRGFERLSDRQRQKLFDALAEGDPTGEVGAAILGKELLRESYFAQTLREAHWRLVRFYGYAAEADVPELTRLASTISRWEQEVLNYHTTRISTGPVEAQNLVTEKIRRIAHGMRNFENYAGARIMPGDGDAAGVGAGHVRDYEDGIGIIRCR